MSTNLIIVHVRVLVSIAGAVLVVLMLAEFFTTFMLPRRVRRDPRIARRIVRGVRTSRREVAISQLDPGSMRDTGRRPPPVVEAALGARPSRKAPFTKTPQRARKSSAATLVKAGVN